MVPYLALFCSTGTIFTVNLKITFKKTIFFPQICRRDSTFHPMFKISMFQRELKTVMTPLSCDVTSVTLFGDVKHRTGTVERTVYIYISLYNDEAL